MAREGRENLPLPPPPSNNLFNCSHLQEFFSLSAPRVVPPLPFCQGLCNYAHLLLQPLRAPAACAPQPQSRQDCPALPEAAGEREGSAR